MSDENGMHQAMADLLDDDAEGWARLQGLFAMLALPLIHDSDGRFRKRIIEVEISAGRWIAIDGAALEMQRLIVWSGMNGTRSTYEFRRSEGVPQWRAPKEESRAKGFIVP
jgi:hypothetical protein